MTLNIVLLIVALLAVVKSADWFLVAAEKVGVTMRLPPFILGVVLVGFGTSLPELATSLAAVSDGISTVTIPNVAGSNIANVLIVLGISTIVLGTIKFEKNLIDLDIPLLVGVTALFSILIIDGSLSRPEGILLLIGFAGYIVYALGYKEDSQYHKGLVSLVSTLVKRPRTKIEMHQNLIGRYTILMLVFSVLLLGVASKVAVDSLLGIVEEVNVGVAVLSFFALAIGTSLPELVVSIKALRKGQGDLVVGNVIGSSMFNILLIAGIASTIRTQVVSPELVGWLIVGMSLAVILLMAGSISKRIHMWEGFIYLLIYLAISSNIISL